MRPIDDPTQLRSGSVIRFISGRRQGEERVILANVPRGELCITADGDVKYKDLTEHAVFIRRDDRELENGLLQREWIRGLWEDSSDSALTSPKPSC